MRKADVEKLQRALNKSGIVKRGKHDKRRKKTKTSVSLPHPTHTNAEEAISLDAMIKSSMFRFINEKLYTSKSEDAKKLFEEDASAFGVYHNGFQQQLHKWPKDPLQWIVDYLMSCYAEGSKRVRIADMGCGDARLADALATKFKIHSFDLVAVNEKVTACDMSKTPLKPESVQFVVFCLSLMGTNCRDFIYEANRILKTEGELLIVDVASRFDGQFNGFLKKLKLFGFRINCSETTKDTYFVRARLRKAVDCTHKPVSQLPPIKLNPCIYKKR